MNYLFLLLCVTAMSLTAAGRATGDEFVSIGGRFAIGLPSNYAEYKTFFDYEIGGSKFSGSTYRWELGREQAVVSYAAGRSNLEKPSNSESVLDAIRGDLLKKVSGGSIVAEKRTSLEGHPGRIHVIESNGNRTMVWIYLVKNRYYLLSLTLGDPGKVEDNVKLLSTFRLATWADLKPRYERLVEDLSPEPLPQIASKKRPTSDSQDLHLRGNVERIVTEEEEFLEGELIGVRRLSSDQEFSPNGDIVREVHYAGSLPHSVRSYGYLDGERAFVERRREAFVALISSKDKKVSARQPANDPKTRRFEIKYTYDSTNHLAEVRTLGENNREVERYKYTKGKVERTYFPLSSVLGLGALLEGDKVREIHILDDIGNPAETRRMTREPSPRYPPGIGNQKDADYTERFKTETYLHKYEFDDRGNWIKRTTTLLNTDKRTATPLYVMYRSLTYR